MERAKLERMAEEMELDNVRFMPRQPMHAMGGILAGADVLLVHLKDDPLFRITIPSKTQAYMAAGKPIIMAVRGDAADLVKRSQSGVLCEPSAPQSIADAVKELADAGPEKLAAMGHNGSAFYDRELSVFIGANAFDRVFRAVGELARGIRYRQSGWRFWIKSVFDRGAALCGLIVLSPLFIGVSVLAWLSMGRPIFFRTKRQSPPQRADQQSQVAGVADHAINPARDQLMSMLDCNQPAEPITKHIDRPDAQRAAGCEKSHANPANGIPIDGPKSVPVCVSGQVCDQDCNYAEGYQHPAVRPVFLFAGTDICASEERHHGQRNRSNRQGIKSRMREEDGKSTPAEDGETELEEHRCDCDKRHFD